MCKGNSTTRSAEAKVPQDEFFEPHPLVRDGWLTPDPGEHSTVPSYAIADITRAALAIRCMSRLVHNSLDEPDASDAQPLPAAVHDDLLSGVEILSKHIYDLADEMRSRARMFRAADEQEVRRG